MSSISPPQQEIVDLVQQGVTTISALAAKLGKSEGIINAQITRIQNSGNEQLVSSIQKTTNSTRSSSRPTNTGGSSNKQMLQGAVDAGEANYTIPDELVNAARQYSQDRDVHPMVLLGITIQFCKLVGGRLASHQLIEQVYEALRVMVSDGSPKVGSEDWSAPWPLNTVEAENANLKQQIADLKERLGEALETTVSEDTLSEPSTSLKVRGRYKRKPRKGSSDG